ncbi:MAG: hypothetical protein KZQ64_06130 [gamma proteobacterium symbiont of Bathyaustriella thionipta]|nr:hypothetical protein [gamma proteobacterium symbiont of Bathyaustriella thionipta]MCU7949557.1 hypothetical protein [gamma proteobacterium symbiont of Bathyaustriella thionipta]MCU7952955.1 hypothetical protein [gamma proteobacterium symbiont of Bathyaustriella thionipta]MCU7956149.1 hypothetical protein [gamma proteobacterium symbiont of Bathyaustriella thionipta]MCU7967941.1 hypothetical protein [gamma proteobacterium symbiont of Bathyaustriella thionipta]
MNKIKTMYLAIICLINLFVISLSYAEEKSTSQTSSEILTSSELSQCQDKTRLLAQTATQLNQYSNQFETQKNEISQLKEDRKQAYSELDFHSQADVDNYNQLNKQLKQLSQMYLSDVESYNAAVERYKADIKQHIIECDDKKYFLK